MSTLAGPIPDLTAAESRHRKRWIPVSLRIFVAILVPLLISSVSSIWWPYYEEQQVIQIINGCNGEFVAETFSPEWLLRLAGEDRMKVFERVVGVELRGPEISDVQIAHLSKLTNLKRLLLRRITINQAGLVHLSRLTNLHGLSLFGTAFTDSDLVHLSKLTNLRQLELSATAVTDKGVDELQKALPACAIRH